MYVSGSPFETLSREPALLLAVSGGPDSTALLLMAAEWATERGSPKLFAATVEHGFRVESAAEAEHVAALAARLGVMHATLVWEGDKPSARLQERAREARYGLLAAHARAVGARVIVTAHHLDDQAETVLMRLTRGSGVAGLAGMAARSRRGDIEIARPLLAIPKAKLIAFCEARGVDYARDPSNADPRFARPRLRGIAEALAAEGLDAPALARFARRAATVEAALAAKTAEAEARLRLVETGRCDGRALASEPVEIVRRLLTLAVAKVSGAAPSRVPLEAMERIADEFVAAVLAQREYAANVAGALIVRDRSGAARVEVEPARRPSRPETSRARIKGPGR